MVAKIILKSGAHIDVECDHFTVNYDFSLRPVSITTEGYTQNDPVYINPDEIAAIVMVS
jgi:hypothetical protein